MFEMQLQGFDSVSIKVNAIFERVQGDRLLTLLGNLVRSQTVKHFQIEEGPAGKWAPLKASTVARKRGGAGQILTDTGRLRGSVMSIVGSDMVEIGTNVHYGKYHQGGTRRMVARPFVGLTADDKDELEHVLNNFISSVLGP